MKHAIAIKSIAFTALFMLAASSFSHENIVHDRPGARKKEQTDWGIAGDGKAVQRTITLTMSDDMRFTPDRIAVNQGDTVRLVLRNKGKILHELVIGTKQVLEEHAALMLRFPGMEHDEPYMAHVAPGTTGRITWTFNRAGEFDFACLIAGHYQAGMRGRISVSATHPSVKSPSQGAQP